MNTYYIVYKWRRKSIGFMDIKTDKESSEIVTIDHDLDSFIGLRAFIKEYKGHLGEEFILLSWHKLKAKVVE